MSNSFKSLTEKLGSKVVDSRFVSVFRILFFANSFYLGLDGLIQFEYLFGYTAQHKQLVAQLIIVTWMVVNAIIVFGSRSTVLTIVSFLLGAIFLEKSAGIYTVEAKFFMIGAFWSIFIIPGSDKGSTKSWPIYVFFVSISAYLFFGGFTAKILDPLWVNGVGLYYVMLLPYIKPDYLSSLLNYEFLLKILNYQVLLFEASIFPLFLFKKTRILAYYFFLGFSIFLFYPLRIDTIGIEGISFAILFSSLFFSLPERIKIRRLTRPIKNALLSRIDSKLNTILDKSLPLHIVLIVIIVLYRSLSFLGTIQYPLLSSQNMEYSAQKKDYSIFPGFPKISPLEKLNAYTYHINDDALFTSYHFLGVYGFRVVAKNSEKKKDVISVFKEDLTGGPATINFLATRWQQAHMYNVNSLISVTKNWSDGEKRVYSPEDFFLVDGYNKIYIDYLLKKISDENYDKLQFLIKPIMMPEEYAGDVRKWENLNWDLLFEYDVASRLYTVYKYKPMPFKIKIPNSDEYLIHTGQ